jgi:hypothetical protein
MKPNEIDEGALNWLARKGLFGTRAGIKATGKHLVGQHSDLQNATANLEKAKFVKRLADSLKQAIHSNLVIWPPVTSASTTVTPQANVQLPANYNIPAPTPALASVPESTNFDRLNRIVESIILHESITLSAYLVDYVKSLTSNMNLQADDETALNAIMADIATNYKGPGKQLPNSVYKLWDALQAIKAKTSPDSHPAPADGTQVSTQRGVYSYNSGQWAMTHRFDIDNITGKRKVVPVTPSPETNPKNIAQLNKLAAQV